MEPSQALLTAQVHFLDTSIALIHIPLHLYNHFMQPILQLVLPAESSSAEAADSAALRDDVARDQRPWAYDHPFVNVSVTPVECSVACSVILADKLFKPILDHLDVTAKEEVNISEEQYVVIQVDGEGLDASQRVLELSSPLAMNGISIFFYSTYFSDYILVPLRSRAAVISALEDGGFAFSKESEGFVNVSSPLLRPSSQHRGSASTTSLSGSQDAYFPKDTTDADTPSSPDPLPPLTPPPSSLSELENRTFKLLKRRKVVPTVDRTIALVQCAGRKDTLRSGIGAHASSVAMQHRLLLGIVKCLTTMPRARFFSLTLTDTEPASLLLEKRLLVNFDEPVVSSSGKSEDVVLLGRRESVLVPITLDLKELPMESTGIVCGVAGRLVGGRKMRREMGNTAAVNEEAVFEDEPLEMSYLSTAKAGTVIISVEELDWALEALEDDTS